MKKNINREMTEESSPDMWGREITLGSVVRVEHGRLHGESLKHWRVYAYTIGMVEKFHPKSNRVTVRTYEYERLSAAGNKVEPLPKARKVYSRDSIVRDDERGERRARQNNNGA